MSGASSREVQSKDFSVPLSFDAVGEGFQLLPIDVIYDLESSDGHSLQMGPLTIDPKNLMLNVLPASRLDSRLSKVLPASARREMVFLFRWPDHVLEEGNLELISRTGKVLWSLRIGEDEKRSWRESLKDWRAALKKAGLSPEEISKAPLFQIQYGQRHLTNAKNPLAQVNEPFRACFSENKDEGVTRVCSAFYEVIRQKRSWRLALVPVSAAPPRVIFMNQEAKLRDELEVPLGEPVQFYAELRSGMSFEFSARPQAVHFIDISKEPAQDDISMIIEGPHPLTDAEQTRAEKMSRFFEMIGWQQTIGDLRQFWKLKVSSKSSSLMVPGKGGGIFRQRFEFHYLPSTELRPYVDRRTVEGTYVDGVKVFGRKPAELDIASQENSVAVTSKDKMEFTWRFGAKKRGEMNRSYLTLTDGEKTYKSYYELYKGYPREISARLSGTMSSENNILMMTELAFNYWFEDFFGWTNYYIARQRWGLSAKTFQSSGALKIGGRQDDLNVDTAELKYRLNPGLWARDETWGLLLGYQRLSYDIFEGQFFGGGIFWARSMPKIFDKWISYFPFMKYPKWVDLEFIYYASSVTDKLSVNQAGAGNGTWALNFHGQVMWTNSFFGEAGFGVKQYDISKRVGSISTRLAFSTFYGTVGIGYRF